MPQLSNTTTFTILPHDRLSGDNSMFMINQPIPIVPGHNGVVAQSAMDQQHNKNQTNNKEIIHADDDEEIDNVHTENEYDDSDWIMIECFDVDTMNIIHSINFHDCVASKIMSINCFVNDITDNHDDMDRVLCSVGCEFSHDMVVFNVLQKLEDIHSSI